MTDEQKKLCTDNIRLVPYTALKFTNNHVDIDDLIGAGYEGLCKAAIHFDPARDNSGSFVPYAVLCIRTSILMFLRSARRHVSTVSLDAQMFEDGNGSFMGTLQDAGEPLEEQAERIDLAERAVAYMAALTEDERCELTLRFGLDGGPCEKQQDIADFLGVSQSFCSRRIQRSCAKIKVLMEG